MNRLREAREYCGFSLEEVAQITRNFGSIIDYMEDGLHQPTPLMWSALSALYRRPVEWLKGKPAPPVEIALDLARAMDRLSDHDRSEVVRFAEFLAHRRESAP